MPLSKTSTTELRNTTSIIAWRGKQSLNVLLFWIVIFRSNRKLIGPDDGDNVAVLVVVGIGVVVVVTNGVVVVGDSVVTDISDIVVDVKEVKSIVIVVVVEPSLLDVVVVGGNVVKVVVDGAVVSIETSAHRPFWVLTKTL